MKLGNAGSLLTEHSAVFVVQSTNTLTDGRQWEAERWLPLTTAAHLWPYVEKRGFLYVGPVKNTINAYTSNCL